MSFSNLPESLKDVHPTRLVDGDKLASLRKARTRRGGPAGAIFPSQVTAR
jgi:hypothetical protein